MLNVVYLFHRRIIIFQHKFRVTEVFVRTINSVAAPKVTSETIATTFVLRTLCGISLFYSRTSPSVR
jgi:hypothetical protein